MCTSNVTTLILTLAKIRPGNATFLTDETTKVWKIHLKKKKKTS